MDYSLKSMKYKFNIMNEDKLKIEGSHLVRCDKNVKGHVEIPQGVTVIEEMAFEECEGLTSVVIPEGVTEMSGCGTFADCINLHSVVIPASLINISSDTFQRCPNLTDIKVSPDNPKYLVDGSAIYNIDRTELICFPSANDVVIIPDSVTSIGKSAFSGAKKLTRVVIPSGVTQIDDDVFHDCVKLTEIVLPTDLTSIGKMAFAGCVSLEKIVLPEGLTKIGSDAFNSCRKLSNIVIPKSVEYIGVWAFEGCRQVLKL